MRRERVSQVVLALIGLLFLSWTYPLFDSLSHFSWFQKHQDPFPMFMSVNAVLGVFLLLAAKQPARHRSLIAFGGWSTLAHASTMLVMSIEAWSRGAQRRDSPQDIVIVGAIGLLLLAVLPARDPAVAHTERSHSPRTSVHPDPVGA